MNRPHEAIDRIELSIKKLKTEYEKYFAGVERIEPLQQRLDLKKELRRLLTQRSNNTAVRFRMQNLQASMVTHEAYWNRITRQIEEGTYHRDLARLQRRQAEAEQTEAPAPAKKKKEPPKKEYPASLRKLHEAFTKARNQVGEQRPIAIETLAATVRKQVTAIKQRYNCDRVEFKVTVKDGKAILKAVPK